MSRSDFLRLLDPAIGQAGLLHGERLVHAMREVVGDPLIETLPVHFTAVAVDLQRQREVWLRSGAAVGCDPRLVRDPGPVHAARRARPRTGRRRPAGAVADRGDAPVGCASADRGRHAWLAAASARRTGRQPAQPAHGDRCARASAAGSSASSAWPGSDTDIGLLELMSRSLDTMQAQISRVQLALDPPELVIRIPRDACLFYEFWRAKELIAIGRSEAEKALDAAGY